MNESTPTKEESIGNQLIEEISKIQQIALGEGVAACQVCGAELPDGAPVTVFVYRPAGQLSFEVGYVCCGGNEHDLPTYFTLGVRDLISDGRVGRCMDPCMDSSWPVLLEPVVRAVSAMDSTTARIAPALSSESSSDRLTGSGSSSETASSSVDVSVGSSVSSSADGVAWVYGDALIERASSNEDVEDNGQTDDEIVSAEEQSTADGDALDATEGGEC